MVHSSIIMRLIAKIPDEQKELRELIRDQYYLDVEESTNAAQAAFIDLVDSHEEKVKLSLDDIGKMVNESVTLSREGGVVLRQLQSDFQSIVETVTGITLDINDIKQAIKSHSQDIESFRNSRDQSIAERRQHTAGLEEGRVSRSKMNDRLDVIDAHIQSLEEVTHRLEEIIQRFVDNQ